ncbi:CurL C-terminal domain-containing protein [Streptomyces olivaceoviridis]|uniref:CurL C-terminal domain-containing protein n=1 Tax=Streptomyces olivaceoviridis TaxID=1921 RepID=UPI003329D5D9
MTAQPVVVGSLKTNFGHMEGAAGVGGIIKTVLQLREKTIFPHLNFVTPSFRIAWEDAPVTVRDRHHRVDRAGEAPAPAEPAEPPADERPGAVLTLSAKGRKSLRRLAERHLDHLAHTPDLAVADLCRTSNTGRAHFRYRMAEVVHDRESALRALRKRIAGPGTAEHHGRAWVPRCTASTPPSVTPSTPPTAFSRR